MLIWPVWSSLAWGGLPGTFQSLRSFSIERHPTHYDLHVSILQELFVGHLLFSLSWNVTPGFGSEKLGWFGVRGGWPPQLQLHLVRQNAAGCNLTVESECVFKTSSNWVLHLSSCIKGRTGGIVRYFSIRVQILQFQERAQEWFSGTEMRAQKWARFLSLR